VTHALFRQPIFARLSAREMLGYLTPLRTPGALQVSPRGWRGHQEGCNEGCPPPTPRSEHSAPPIDTFANFRVMNKIESVSW